MNKYLNRDCLEVLGELADGSVDLFVQDPWYGVTQNPADRVTDLGLMWGEWLRVGKERCAFVFTSQQPFTTDLITSMRKYFKFCLVWHKDRPRGHLNARRQPMRDHEDIVVFYRKQPVYNPQKWWGEPEHGKSHGVISRVNNNYEEFKQTGNPGNRLKYPRSVWRYACPHPPIHPNQKPVKLFEDIVKTWSNPGGLVFDGYAGVGTTHVACVHTGRSSISCEIDPEHYRKGLMEISRIQTFLF